MGYATHLYSVDITALKSAIGSKDEALLERIRAAVEKQNGKGTKGKKPPVATTPSPRIRVSYRSELELNGEPVTTAQLRKFLVRPELAGMTIITFQEDPPRGKKREGEFQELGSFYRDFLFRIKGHFNGFKDVTRQQFDQLGDSSEIMTTDLALAELIAGIPPSQPDKDHHYGYALERLCRGLGTFLGAVGTDVLRALKLDTPLSKQRSPVKLPKIHDFPVISFLDAAGLEAEVARLKGMDLSYPQETAIERERRLFLKVLEKGVKKKGRGVVGFYY